MHSYERLTVWQKAHELALRVFQATARISERRFPSLASQMRRSAISIPAAIAEGSGFEAAGQFSRHLEIAIGSAHELQYHVRLAADLGVIGMTERAKLEARAAEVARMLTGLRKRVRERSAKARAPRRATKE